VPYVLFLIFATSISAQFMSIGVEGGLPLSQRFRAQTTDPNGLFGRCAECATERTVPYTVGLSLDIHLVGPFSLTADALFNRADYNHTTTELTSPPANLIFFEKHVVDRWEIPILLKYGMTPRHSVNPFVSAGVSLQHNQDFTESRFDVFPLTGAVSQDTRNIFGPLGVAETSMGLGGTAVVGATFGHRRVRPLLEYRYTRWFSQPVVAVPRLASFPGAPRPPYFAVSTLTSSLQKLKSELM